MEELMEMICDHCHYPWITTEEELEDYCAECEIEKELQKLIKQAEGAGVIAMTRIVAESMKDVLNQEGPV